MSLIRYFPYNLFQVIFIYHYLLGLDGEPPSYAYAGRALGVRPQSIMEDAMRVEKIGLGKVNKGGRPYTVAWLSLNQHGAQMYSLALTGVAPLCLLTDVSVPPSKFVLDTLEDVEIVTLSRLEYFRALDDIKAITGIGHRSDRASASL